MLMDANRISDLQRMHNLFLRVGALELLKQSLSAYIKASGNGVIMDDEKDKDMVSWLLDFKARLDMVWEESFSKNEAFANAIKDAFEHLINLRQVLFESLWFFPDWSRFSTIVFSHFNLQCRIDQQN